MLNRKTITKKDISDLLHQYKENKGVWRSAFGATKGMKALSYFLHTYLINREDSYQLQNNEIEQLVTILHERFTRLLNKNNNYHTQATKQTNIIYKKLAQLVSSDPKILALVQYYKNDYTVSGKLLAECTDDIFVTEAKYAFPIAELIKHLQVTESLTYPIPKTSLQQSSMLLRGQLIFKRFSKKDLIALEQIPSLAQEINIIKNKLTQYKTWESLTGEALWFFPKDKRFVSKDGFCFLIADLVKILEMQNKIYNPHTKQVFAAEDIDKIMDFPPIKYANKLISLKQAHCRQHISAATIKQLTLLAEGLLNDKEINAERNDPVARAQFAYEKFNTYYQGLSKQEREAVNDYWIEGWEGIDVYYISGTVRGSGPIKFRQVYESLHEQCVHTNGGCLVKMVLQLNPNVTFNLTSFAGKRIINYLRQDTRSNSAYVTPHLYRARS